MIANLEVWWNCHNKKALGLNLMDNSLEFSSCMGFLQLPPKHRLL